MLAPLLMAVWFERPLQVTGSLRLTDNGVEAMAAACPRLLHVDLSGCPKVTRSVHELVLSSSAHVFSFPLC